MASRDREYGTRLTSVGSKSNSPPPFCYVILGPNKGDVVVSIVNGEKSLTIFGSWKDAQYHIDQYGLFGFRPKILYWPEVVARFNGVMDKAILDLKDGSSPTFSLQL